MLFLPSDCWSTIRIPRDRHLNECRGSGVGKGKGQTRAGREGPPACGHCLYPLHNGALQERYCSQEPQQEHHAWPIVSFLVTQTRKKLFSGLLHIQNTESIINVASWCGFYSQSNPFLTVNLAEAASYLT